MQIQYFYNSSVQLDLYLLSSNFNHIKSRVSLLRLSPKPSNSTLKLCF